MGCYKKRIKDVCVCCGCEVEEDARVLTRGGGGCNDNAKEDIGRGGGGGLKDKEEEEDAMRRSSHA